MIARRLVLPYLGLVAIATILLWALKLPISRLDVPYMFVGDAIDKLVQIETVKETGWLFHNDRLGYPFGYDRLDFPRFDSLNYALMAPVAALTGQPGIAMNLYFVAGFYLIAFAAFYSFRRLGLLTGPAMLCALLYAFLPYHVLRGVPHLTNGAYYLVPLAMLVLVWLAQERFDRDVPDAQRRWLFALAVAALLPLQMPYNGVFFAFLCIVAAAIAISRSARWHTVLVTLSLLAATACAFVVEQVPVVLHMLKTGNPSLVAQRTPGEAEVYSLQLNQVLLPTAVDRRRDVTKQVAAFDAEMGIPATEARNQYIGLLGVFGFAALLWALCRAAGMRMLPGGTSADPEHAVRIAAVLAIAVLLLAISSGLCTLIAYWITAKIRAYNRILPFFAFACLLGGGWVLQVMTERIRMRWLRHAVITLIGAYALFDVLVRSPFALRANDIAEYDRSRAYFAGVETQLGEGAAVFQLPAVWYPEHPPVNGMGDYEEFKPFLLTRSLRFSYGSSRDRNGYQWGKFVENLPVNDMIAQTHAFGFAAILIDGSAYASEEARKTATDALALALPQTPVVSPDHRWWLFPLEGCCGAPVPQIESGKAPAVFAYAIDTGPLRFAAGSAGVLYGTSGWEDPESWGMWTLGDRARLRMRIEPVPDGALAVTLDTQMVLGPKLPRRTLHIECNGCRVADAVYTADTAVQRLLVDIPAGAIGKDGILQLDFTIAPSGSPQSAGLNEDPRAIALGLIELSIARADKAP